jgi:pimeloyl-ACP methyl ester carboxylesterase
MVVKTVQSIDAGCSSEAIKLFLTEGPEVPPQAMDAMEASQGWPHMEAIVHTLPYDLAICGDQVVPHSRLANINIPTLALSGGASPEWARIAVDAVAAAIPGTQHASLDGQTHGVADDVIAPVLARFFLN